MRTDKRKREADTFAMLEAAAAAGQRCPMSHPHGDLSSPATSALAHAGRIRVEIFRHNWRVVTIMEGQHTGKQTAPPPGAPSRPYKVVYRDHVMIPESRRSE